MNSAMVMLIASALIKYGPGMARELVKLFSNPAPTLEDWEKVFALADKPYEAYTQPLPPELIAALSTPPKANV